ILNAPIVCLITEGRLTNENFESGSKNLLATIKSTFEAGLTYIQIREKRLSAKNVFHLTSEAVSIARDSPTKILVNDRADIAAAARADGVQLTEASLSISVIRSAFPDLIVGVSTHSVSSVENVAKSGAAFALFGPVFPTHGKENAQGIDELSKACAVAPGFPVLAIGGIDETNYRRVLAAGCAGFAAIRWLNDETHLRFFRENGS
ncbi:MAG: thiamine phosphate synthase, partial [Acidobacteriota bacterium]